MSTGDTFLVLSAFLASGVEFVEALTLVLAVLVVALGPALTVIPIQALRLVVGTLLLIFGLQWLRKAILRASGYKPTRDEAAIYRAQLAEEQGANAKTGSGVDWYAFTLAFKSVFLEGFEVAFI